MVTMGGRIQTFREQRKLTTKEVSQEVGISRSFLSAIENDKRDPPISVVVKLARVVQRSLTEVVEGQVLPVVGGRLDLIKAAAGKRR